MYLTKNGKYHSKSRSNLNLYKTKLGMQEIHRIFLEKSQKFLGSLRYAQ